MRKIILYLVCLIAILSSCKIINDKDNAKHQKSGKIKVGVFDKNGDSPYCITDAVEALRIDKDIESRVISAADIMLGKTNDIDVYLFPGGSGRAETGSLGELGQQKVIDLVTKSGKGVVGICAGAYILSETPDYPSLGLSGVEAIDIEHDHRGHGLVKFALTDAGEKIFPELIGRSVSYSQYYEGPVLIPAKASKYQYSELATMLSDVHLIEGTPKNMTNNRPFIIVTEAGKGKAASVVGHPESTPGMRWVIPRLVRVVANKALISYSKHVVRPYIYSKEVLFTPEMLEKQRKAYYNLTGTRKQKLKALFDIRNMQAWSAKKWIPPMMRDKDFEVRLLAAQFTAELERTDAIPDFQAAIANETNPTHKKQLHEQLDILKRILP